MAFAIYGESLGYIHLVASDSEDAVVSQFVTDVEGVGVNLKDVYGVIAVENSKEHPGLEDRVRALILEAAGVMDV